MSNDEQRDVLERHQGWLRYARLMRRFDWLVVIMSIALFALCFHYVKQIRVKSDFKEMLPERYRSVMELNKLEQRTRSTGNLIVLIGNAPWPAMKQFIEDFSARAGAELGDVVSRVEYSAKETGDFFDKNKFLYINLDDLKEVDDRLQRQLDYEKLNATGLYLDLDDEKPKFDISDIESKYKSKTGNFLNYKDGYFTTSDASLAAVILKPREGATNVQFAEKLIARARGLMESMNPASYDPNLKFGFGGRYQKMVTEYKALIGDILKTTLLCFIMVGGVVFLYYRRIKPCIVVSITVAQGVLIALAVGYLAIGYLTTQTAFLGSIIVGNGINFGLILMARYVEERREKGREVADAMAIALSQTWKPTLVAASTTSASFAVLMLTHIRGFSQFGFIGGIGMSVCWLCTYFFLPAWLSLAERIWLTKVGSSQSNTYYRAFGWLARVTVSHYRPILKWTLIIGCAALISTVIYLPNSLEYNFEKIKFKPPKETAEKWELDARTKISDIFSQSTTPEVVLVDRPDQADQVCDVITQRTSTPENADMLDDCKTLYSFVPKDQPEKLVILADMREKLSSSSLKFLNEDQKKEVEKFKNTLDLEPVKLSDLPQTIVNNFEESDGSLGKIVYVYPKPTMDMWNGRVLMRFADLIKEVDLPDGEKIYASGEALIFADLLRAVVKEGPVATTLSFIAVLILIMINFKGTKESAIVMLSLLVGVVLLVGLLPVVGVKLNFLNFIALPITFGIGVDYAVNIYQRYKQDGKGSVANVIKYSGGAVTLCSLTTIIGYSVLLTSRSLGLVSFGLVALLGEFTCISAAIISLPSFITWLEQRKDKI